MKSYVNVVKFYESEVLMVSDKMKGLLAGSSVIRAMFEDVKDLLRSMEVKRYMTSDLATPSPTLPRT